ncbi:MAG: YifB family Mg chelatase-like AAA ATPase [Caldimicrobium sp.]|nr:YifB family Mg chelatase-like AAA ATPase [Caldimicrobium sp.]MCX7613695.1 YifB family Mg chelatase-like AAA ATPase [Caldimicrobium sp.]MDW8183147.1 YifB family Mg chelatase-like AAA ATPase [Caldimicrobium sp.]
MLCKSLSFYLLGLEAFPVEVEVDLSRGLPGVTIVGLPDSSIKESRERIRSAVINSGFEFPLQKITVNLSPADLKKEGTAFDLAIALGILAGSRVIEQEQLRDIAIMGELSLDGSIKGTKGILSAVIKAKEMKLKEIFIPRENLREAGLVRDFRVVPFRHLREVIDYLRGLFTPDSSNETDPLFEEADVSEDFSEIQGQTMAKRAFEIAAAGGHNLLIIGPPGAGKTMLSQRMPSILPPLSYEEALETTKIYSVAGLLNFEKPFILQRPFRNPHFTISEAGLIGGGTIPKPGEVSLAHNGCLFLDEFPEFRRDVIEALRQPLEDGQVTITRASFTVTYPSRFLLICAMNPCKCGYLGHPSKACTCSFQEIKKYRSKLSGPIVDRMDIHLEVPPVEIRDLLYDRGAPQEGSKAIRERVVRARQLQERRYGIPGKLNAHLKPREIKKFFVFEHGAMEFIEKALERLGLSARAIHKVLKVARTIADLEDCDIIKKTHLSEALQYRVLERKVYE